MMDIAKDDYDWLEWQANTFAGLLLVPSENLRQRTEYIQGLMREGGINPSRLDEPSVDRVVRLLAQHFAVSPGVIERRLRKDGCWPLIA